MSRPSTDNPTGHSAGRGAGYSTGADRPIHQVTTDGRIIGEIRSDTPIFVISVAAVLAGMHAQTLRSYDREGLVSPGRTRGGGRRYSQRDIELLREVQRLSQDDGVNRAGIRRIIELEATVDALRSRVGELLDEVAALRTDLTASRVDVGRPAPGVSVHAGVVSWPVAGTAMVTWRPARRI